MRIKIFVPKDKPLKDVNIPDAVEQIMKRGMKQAQKQAKLNVSGGGSFSKSKSRLSSRTGWLRSNINWGYERDGLTHRGIIGVSDKVPYARIHEEGGTIVPKTAKALAIPLRHVRWSNAGGGKFMQKSYSGFTGAGQKRYPGPRDVPYETFILKRHGRVYIMGKVGKNKVVPLFLLVKRVDIPKRPYLRPALTSVIPQVMQEIGTRIVKDAESGKRTA